MSSTQPPNDPPNPSGNPEKKPETSSSTPAAAQDGAAAMDTTPDAPPAEETWDDIPEDILSLSTDEIISRTRLIDNDIKVRN